MMTGCVMSGSAVVSVIVWTPVPGILKTIVSVPALAFASKMAWRKLPAPLSFVFATVMVSGPFATATQAENSDVLLAGSVTVAVTVCPALVALASVGLN